MSWDSVAAWQPTRVAASPVASSIGNSCFMAFLLPDEIETMHPGDAT
jgi:hypothetical protein